MYRATAKLLTGEVLEVKGTIREVANWADNVISVYGSCEISIAQEPENALV